MLFSFIVYVKFSYQKKEDEELYHRDASLPET